MIKHIRLTNFKRFENLDLPLGKLTLLSGVNGGGKSSVLQALVLLAQTFATREWGRSLLLEGPELALGNVADILYQHAKSRTISIEVQSEDEQIAWQFSADDRRALAMDLANVTRNGEPADSSDRLRWLLPADMAENSPLVGEIKGLSWITAERIGPRELMPLRDREDHNRVGHRGEFAAGLVYWREDDPVGSPFILEDYPPTMFHQIRGRMNQFFPGSDFRVTPVDGTNAVSLRLRLGSRLDFQRPQNVGFGLTQIFPIIVALQSASPGDLLIIENPEVHLHPSAQQQVGRLIAEVAQTGAQIIIESHSDHVLNGIRLAVKGGLIESNDVVIHFFAPDSPEGSNALITPQIDADGRLDIWPEGFFDQFDQALSELL